MGEEGREDLLGGEILPGQCASDVENKGSMTWPADVKLAF